MSLACLWKRGLSINFDGGPRKTIHKRSEDESITEDEKSSILAFYKARTRWLTSEQLQITPQWGHESKEEDQGSVTHGDVKVVKEIIMEQAIVKDS